MLVFSVVVFALGLHGIAAAQPVVSVTATVPEAGPGAGVFTIGRTGDTSQPLVVPFGLSGTARNGVDYSLESTSALESQPFAAGVVSEGFNLNGNEQYVEFPDDPNQDPTQEATLDAWVYFTERPSDAGRFMVVVGKSGFAKDLDIQAETDNRFRFYVAGGACCGLFVASNTVIQTNTWYHVAATYKANSAIKMYVNGQLENTTAIAVTRQVNGDPVTIGESSVFRGRFFSGVIDEAHMFARELAASEVASIFNAGSSGLCKPSPVAGCIAAPAGLVGWWPGDGVAVDLVTGRLGVLWGNSIALGGASATIDVVPTGSPGSAGKTVVLKIQPAASYVVSSQSPSGFVTLTGEGPTFSLSSIAPNRGGDTGPVTVEIVGEAIAPGATATLTRSGQPDIPATANTVGTNGVSLTSTFDLAAAPHGTYDIVVTNPGGTPATLAAAFTVEGASPPDLFVKVVARTIIRIGNEYRFFVLYGNRGNTDAPATTLYVSVPSFVSLSADTTFPFTTAPDGDRTLITASLPGVRAATDQAPEVFTIKIKVADPAEAHHHFTTRASIGHPFVVPTALPVAAGVRGGVPPPPDPGPGPDPDDDCCQDEEPGGGGTDPRTPNDPNDKAGPGGVGTAHYVGGGAAIPYAIYFENEDTASLPAQDVSVTDQLDPALVDLTTFSFGPISFGNVTVVPPAAQTQFVKTIDLRPDTPLIVKITAALDAATGKVTWLFNSLDPVTGETPDDPLVGFLPPNKTSPEGQGAVLFTVSPKTTVATGTIIANQARVVFDVNPPIDTPQWTNTIDNAKPSSQVTSVGAPGPDGVAVQWAGSDAESGSLDYTIFVSENGGPFTAWLANTSATNGTFVGTCGKTYGFYSVARDGVGNVEDAPATPDASVTLDVCDFAVTDIRAPANVDLTNRASMTTTVSVQIQNRSAHREIIPDAAALASLVTLRIESLGSCPAPTPVLRSHPVRPITLGSKQRLNVVFNVTFDCANDPADSTTRNPGHEDFRVSAVVNHSALGSADAHPVDDVCPRSVPVSGVVDPNPDGKIVDKGCGTRKADGTYGGPVLIDVIKRPRP